MKSLISFLITVFLMLPGPAVLRAQNNLLHFASESDSAELIDCLIGLGVPAGRTNIFGRKPLHIAAANINLQTLKSLLK